MSKFGKEIPSNEPIVIFRKKLNLQLMNTDTDILLHAYQQVEVNMDDLRLVHCCVYEANIQGVYVIITF